ncbi:BTB/POZ domain-containing protein 6 [Trichinella papuae]|nr:BTB/POZ domain-containing protein 6 [Trichinella papuae]KRZ69174.1 BTB/POZ domain-containing protein 6 [Trichinella papuae]
MEKSSDMYSSTASDSASQPEPFRYCVQEHESNSSALEQPRHATSVMVCDPDNVEIPEEWENQQYLPPARLHRPFSCNLRVRSSSEKEGVNHYSAFYRTSAGLSVSETSLSPPQICAGPLSSSSQATLRERNIAMLFSEVMADVWFVVGTDSTAGGKQRIPAHTYVLATGSTVFYAMFYGNFAKCTEIEVPDVEPDAFRNLLRYLYTDEIYVDNETVISTLYVSKKYFVTYLTRACVEFLQNSLTAKNVCFLLSQSRLFEEEELVERCWDVIDAQAEMALFSDSFLEIDKQALQSILSRDTLNARESKIFEATMRWAEAECHRQMKSPTAANKRLVLGDVFNMIRFPVMQVEDFANLVILSGVLTSEEVVDIILHFFSKEKPKLLFPISQRLGLPLKRCHRFQSSAHRNNQWRYRGRCDSIQFCTDRRIFVAGFGLYGSSNSAAKYTVRLELKRSGQILAQLDTVFMSDGSSRVFPVFFEQPVQIDADVYYTAGMVLEGNELSYFGQEGMPEVQVHNVTFQFQCSTESTNGTGVQGGQIPEILFY